jgi:hypothetical protein
MAIDCVTGHRAFIYDRGGKTRLSEITSLSNVKWQRIRDDISTATLELNGQACQEQAERLGQIEPGRHELVIFRGQERVWEGPVNHLAYSSEALALEAHDVMYYAQRTTMHAAYDNRVTSSGTPPVITDRRTYVTTRAKNILVAELARKEALPPAINVVPFIVDHAVAGNARTAAYTYPFQYQVWEHIDSLAADNGIDYTVVGRAIHLWDTDDNLGVTPTVTEADFLGGIVVSVYGAQLATRAIVTNGDGTYGYAGGTDPYYGEWEILATTDTEEKADDPNLSQDQLNSQALRNLTGRNPTPVLVRIPDNSTLNPTGVLSIADLVPGVHIPLRAKTLIRDLQQMQKLDQVTVEETAAGETIQITLTPAANTAVAAVSGSRL